MHQKWLLFVRSCPNISIFVFFYLFDSWHAWRRLLMIMLLLSFVLLSICFEIQFPLWPHFLHSFFFLKDMVIRSHHRLHFCAHYTLLFLLFFARKVLHLRLDFLFSLSLLGFQPTKFRTYYQLSLHFLLLFDLKCTFFTFLFLLVTIVDTNHLGLHQILYQKRLSLVKAMLPNEFFKLAPIVLWG